MFPLNRLIWKYWLICQAILGDSIISWLKTTLFFVRYYLNYFFLYLTKRCFGAIKKLIAKTIADVKTILDPAAILKEYPMNSPSTEQHAPIVDDKRIIVFRLFA